MVILLLYIVCLLLQYRRVMAYVASRRITLLLLCLVCRVMAYMASRRITLHLLLAVFVVAALDVFVVAGVPAVFLAENM